jgi:hypothetical protein
MHMSRRQMANEKNQIKKALKKEAAKHVGRADRRKEKLARRRTAKKARKVVKNETSIQQQLGGITGNVNAVAVNNIPSPQHDKAGHTFSDGTPTPKDAIATPSATLSNKELLCAVIQKVDRKEANDLPQSARRAEIIRKLAEHKKRQQAKTVVRQAQEHQTRSANHGAATATVTQKPLPHFSPPNPRTSIVNRHRNAAPSSNSPSGYTIAVAKPLLPTETERSLFNSFLHARPSGRGAETTQALTYKNSPDLTQSHHIEAPGARASSPIVLGDESDHEVEEEVEFSHPFNAIHHPTEYINFFSNKDEDRKPKSAPFSVNNRAQITGASRVPALAPAANNPVHVNIDDCITAHRTEEPSDAARERRLDRSIDRELERTTQEATQRPVNALEQLLAKDHAMLFLGQPSTHDAVLHASFEFVRGLRAEHSILNSQCQRYDMELGVLRFRLAQREDNQNKIGQVEQMKIWSEELCAWLLIVENEFRALVAKGEFELKWVLKSEIEAVKKAIERYDLLMASL